MPQENSTMWPWLTAAASVGGEIIGGLFNRSSANKQMAFQERMSSTSAQRAAEDFRRAGLNPALAYDRGASSPSGASTTIGNPLAGGVNSALSAKRTLKELSLLETQRNATEFQGEQAAAQAELNRANANLAYQTWQQNDTLNPILRRIAKANAEQQESLIPGMKAKGALDAKLGIWGPVLSGLLNSGKTATQIFSPFLR